MLIKWLRSRVTVWEGSNKSDWILDPSGLLGQYPYEILEPDH